MKDKRVKRLFKLQRQWTDTYVKIYTQLEKLSKTPPKDFPDVNAVSTIHKLLLTKTRLMNKEIGEIPRVDRK